MIFGLYHAPQENAGLIGEVIKELGLPFKEVHLYEGEGLPRETSDLEGLVVMGGPMSVNDVDQYPFLLPEIQLIEHVIACDKPVLGICLGSQLIAKALGYRVFPNTEKEVGWYPIQLTPEAKDDPLFQSLPKSINVLHWHGETFDLPEGAVHLAKSDRCRNQAFRWKEFTYGFQFHFEVTGGMLIDWCGCDQGRADLASAGQKVDQVIRQAPAAFRKLTPAARNLFTSYFKTAYPKLLSVA